MEEFKKSINLKISNIMDELRNTVPFDEYDQKCQNFESQIQKELKQKSHIYKEEDNSPEKNFKDNIPVNVRIEDLNIKYKSLKNLVNKLIISPKENTTTNELSDLKSNRIFSTHDPSGIKNSNRILPDEFYDSFNNSKLEKTRIKECSSVKSGERGKKSKSLRKKKAKVRKESGVKVNRPKIKKMG